MDNDQHNIPTLPAPANYRPGHLSKLADAAESYLEAERIILQHIKENPLPRELKEGRERA